MKPSSLDAQNGSSITAAFPVTVILPNTTLVGQEGIQLQFDSCRSSINSCLYHLLLAADLFQRAIPLYIMRIAGFGCAGRLNYSVILHSTANIFHMRSRGRFQQGCSPVIGTRCKSARRSESERVQESTDTADHLSNGASHDSTAASAAAEPEIAEPAHAECACGPLGRRS